MATTAQNIYITKIQDLEFFQGDTVTIPFQFVDGGNNPIDLRKVDVFWYCCPYGRYKTPTLILDSITIDSDGIPKIIISDLQPSICYVNLSFEDTQKLNYVKYTHQPVLVLKNSRGTRRYIRAEGNIIFRPHIEDFIV